MANDVYGGAIRALIIANCIRNIVCSTRDLEQSNLSIAKRLLITPHEFLSGYK